jgi:hypothetical protein
MDILYVRGDDYAAMYIEDSLGVKEATKLAKRNGGEYVINNDEVYAELEIKSFGEVDMEFVGFIKFSLMDYDASKHENFFVIEEETD